MIDSELRKSWFDSVWLRGGLKFITIVLFFAFLAYCGGIRIERASGFRPVSILESLTRLFPAETSFHFPKHADGGILYFDRGAMQGPSMLQLQLSLADIEFDSTMKYFTENYPQHFLGIDTKDFISSHEVAKRMKLRQTTGPIIQTVKEQVPPTITDHVYIVYENGPETNSGVILREVERTIVYWVMHH